MRAADLQVGARIVIQDGWAQREAVVLEVGTKWRWTRNGLRELTKPNPGLVAVAILPGLPIPAVPEVVNLNNVLRPVLVVGGCYDDSSVWPDSSYTPIAIDDRVFDNAKWSRRETPADPFQEVTT